MRRAAVLSSDGLDASVGTTPLAPRSRCKPSKRTGWGCRKTSRTVRLPWPCGRSSSSICPNFRQSYRRAASGETEPGEDPGGAGLAIPRDGEFFAETMKVRHVQEKQSARDPCGSGRLQHNGNLVLTWCIGNVVGKADRRGTCVRPRLVQTDAAVALMVAIGRAMADEEARGLQNQRRCTSPLGVGADCSPSTEAAA